MERKRVSNANVMTPARREFFLKILDGDYELVGTMHILNNKKYCDNFLQWLWHNDLKGKKLKEFLQNKFNGNAERMIEFICTKINATMERVPPTDLTFLQQR